MSGQIGGVSAGVPAGVPHQPTNTSAGGSKSFESVLQQMSEQPGNVLQQGSGVSGVTLEQLRADLIKRYTDPSAGDFGLQFDDARLRLSVLRDSIHGLNPNQRPADLLTRFSQVENQWKQIEAMLNSDHELSKGELLALQARMYQLTQNIEILSKVVDQVTGGIKTILQTNL